MKKNVRNDVMDEETSTENSGESLSDSESDSETYIPEMTGTIPEWLEKEPSS